MKNTLLMGTLLLGLVACGNDPAPDSSYPYNPDASATVSTDARTPYRGDWVLVAKLADSTFRYGLVSITTKITSTDVRNAGAGPSAWCLTAACTPIVEEGKSAIGTSVTSDGAFLSVGMFPNGSTSPRFVMTDDDGKVVLSEGRPTISGQGLWVNANGTTQLGTFVFAQISTKSKTNAQQIKQTAELAAQQLSLTSVKPQSLSTLNGVRSALAAALKP